MFLSGAVQDGPFRWEAKMQEPTIHTPSQLEFVVFRIAMVELLQTLASAGAITNGEVRHFCERMARMTLQQPTTPDVVAY